MFSVKGGFSGQGRQVYRMPPRLSFHWKERRQHRRFACATGAPDRALSAHCFRHPINKYLWKYPYRTHKNFLWFLLPRAYKKHIDILFFVNNQGLTFALWKAQTCFDFEN
jgi:hypothetical protein